MAGATEHRPPWPETAEELADFWAHRVSRRAFDSLRNWFAATTGIILFVLGAAGLYVWEQTQLLMQERVRVEIAERIAHAVEDELNPAVRRLKDDINARADAAGHRLGALQEEARAELEGLLQEARAELRQMQEIRIAIDDYLRSLEQRGQPVAALPPDAALPEDGAPVAEAGAPACDPQALDAEQKAALAVRQNVTPTGQTAGDRALYENTFRLAFEDEGGAGTGEGTPECLLAAVDRVVYSMNPAWFEPWRNVRTDRASRFEYSVLAWGVTTIEIEVYLVGEQGKVCTKGLLRAGRASEHLLEPTSCEALAYGLAQAN